MPPPKKPLRIERLACGIIGTMNTQDLPHGIKNNLTGKRYGMLVVVAHAGFTNARQSKWLCKCDCGNEKIVVGQNLTRSWTRSCGCFRKRTTTTRKTKHGMSTTPEYRTWEHIIQRCHNQNYTQFHLYGGRGIYVCDEWRASFVTFFSDMGKRPSAKHSIDRIDGNGPYSPENCRWATTEQQAKNRRNVRIITVAGVSHSIPEWSELTGIPYGTLATRLSRWHDDEKAITTPYTQSMR